MSSRSGRTLSSLGKREAVRRLSCSSRSPASMKPANVDASELELDLGLIPASVMSLAATLYATLFCTDAFKTTASSSRTSTAVASAKVRISSLPCDRADCCKSRACSNSTQSLAAKLAHATASSADCLDLPLSPLGRAVLAVPSRAAAIDAAAAASAAAAAARAAAAEPAAVPDAPAGPPPIDGGMTPAKPSSDGASILE
mmetsp:Transcript_12873/g.29124  ORF Transcript_12873/g.29124 Transcript_12873/m.29124 type:complete len:200 (-) Transcript_12873:282-881(-)